GLLGAHYTAGPIRIGGGAGVGFTRGYGSPASRLVATIDWMPAIEERKVQPLAPPSDRDRNGVLDGEDACPDVFGVRTNDARTNGCPAPPPDRDRDGVEDAKD